MLEDDHERRRRPARRAARGASRRGAPAAPGPLVTYSPKVFIPLTTLCRDVCGYCTFARPPRRGERAFMTEDEVLAIARAGAAAGLPRGALHARRQARAALQGRARGASRARLRDDARVPRALRAPRARGDGAPAAPQPRRHDSRRARGAAAGLGLDGDHARDDRRAARREGRPALGLAGQVAGAAPGDDPARGRAPDPVHERDPHRDRRDTRGADRRAARPQGARRGARPRAGGHRPELPREAGDAHGRRIRSRRSTTTSGRSPSRGSCSAPTGTCRRRRTSPSTTSRACSTRASTTGAASRRSRSTT